ncbi:response regulator transcription factor [Noviherbaspirillum sp. 1P10PC]|uniref:response regulator n=1 Tax=Noviherbaspirillum sp. 1P10PC TaxID=3132292 RepID=UPI0039A13630
MPNSEIKVLLVDDHAVVRNGLRVMLASAKDINVANEAESADQALQLVRSERFDVVLLDIAMPDKNGLELLKTLRIEKPRLAVLILSMYSEEMYALRALKLGAAGYLPKNSPGPTLINAVRKAAAGGKYISAGIADQLARMLAGDAVAEHDALSDRELEVLKLLAGGESTTGIADALSLSSSTVATYRTRICDKLKLKNNADLTRYALVNGLLL